MYITFKDPTESHIKENTMQEKEKGNKKSNNSLRIPHNQEKPGTLQLIGPK